MHLWTRLARASAGRPSGKLAGLTALPLAAFILAGCSSTIDNGAINKYVKSNSVKNGQTAKSVSCPSDPAAKVGTKFDCSVTFPDGSSDTAHVEVTSVSGSTVYLHSTLGGAGSSGASSTGASGATTGASGASSTGASGASSSGASGASSSGASGASSTGASGASS